LEKQYLSYVHQCLADDKITEDEAQTMLAAAEQEGPYAPLTLDATDRFKQDLYALGELLKPKSPPPPEVVVWSNSVLQVIYGFGNASEKGFGSTVLNSKGVRIRVGLWEKDSEGDSSNWREFENVVEALEEEGHNSSLNGTLVYFFTNNSMVKAALY
jgi:hypothetical protein